MRTDRGDTKIHFSVNLEASATAKKANTLGNGGRCWRHNPSKFIWWKIDGFCYLRSNSGNVGWCQTFFCSVSGRFWQELSRKQSMFYPRWFLKLPCKVVLGIWGVRRKIKCIFHGTKATVVYVNSSCVCTFCSLRKEQYKNIAKAYSQKWQTALLNSKNILTPYIIHTGRSQ